MYIIYLGTWLNAAVAIRHVTRLLFNDDHYSGVYYTKAPSVWLPFNVLIELNIYVIRFAKRSLIHRQFQDTHFIVIY